MLYIIVLTVVLSIQILLMPAVLFGDNESGYKTIYYNNEGKPDKSPNTSDDREKQNNQYFFAGANLGFPAALNHVVGYNYNSASIMVSGMYYGKPLRGIQLNLLYRVYDGDVFSHALSLVGGSVYVQSKKYNNNISYHYSGLSYILFIHDFFTQIGYSLGQARGTSRGSMDQGRCIIYQIGHVMRF